MRDFLIKVVSAIISLFVGVVVGVLVPRSVGPEVYGEYSYVISISIFILQLLLLEVNFAYMSLRSNKSYDSSDINSLYFLYLSILIILYSLFFVFLDFGGFEYLDVIDVYLVAIVALLIFLQQRFIEFSDFAGWVGLIERWRIATKLILIIFLGGLFVYSNILMHTFLLISCISYSLFFLVAIKLRLKWHRPPFRNIIDISTLALKFILPLAPVALLASVAAFLGKYYLQHSGGVIQQGYYAVAFSIALLPLPVVSGLVALVVRDMSDDGCQVFEIYSSWHKLLSYFYFYWFLLLLLFPSELLVFLLGVEYLGASRALQFLALFSFLHVNSLLNRSLLVLHDRRKLYSIVNFSVLMLSILVLTGLYNYTVVNVDLLSMVVLAGFLVRTLVMKVVLTLAIGASWRDILFSNLKIYISVFALFVFVKALNELGFLAFLESLIVMFVFFLLNTSFQFRVRIFSWIKQTL